MVYSCSLGWTEREIDCSQFSCRLNGIDLSPTHADMELGYLLITTALPSQHQWNCWVCAWERGRNIWPWAKSLEVGKNLFFWTSQDNTSQEGTPGSNSWTSLFSKVLWPNPESSCWKGRAAFCGSCLYLGIRRDWVVSNWTLWNVIHTWLILSMELLRLLALDSASGFACGLAGSAGASTVICRYHRKCSWHFWKVQDWQL